ncbi:hypothetical protein FOZ60_012960, partial [Perkinsus olseni]
MKKLGVSEKAPAGVNSTVDIEGMVANTFAAAVPAATESLKTAEERTSSVDSSSSSSASSVASAAPVALLPSPRRRALSGQLEEESLRRSDAGASSGDAAAPLISPTESGLTGEYSAAGPAATPAFREAGTLSEEDGVSKNFPLDGHGAPPSSTSATPLVGVSEDSVVAARAPSEQNRAAGADDHDDDDDTPMERLMQADLGALLMVISPAVATDEAAAVTPTTARVHRLSALGFHTTYKFSPERDKHCFFKAEGCCQCWVLHQEFSRGALPQDASSTPDQCLPEVASYLTPCPEDEVIHQVRLERVQRKSPDEASGCRGQSEITYQKLSLLLATNVSA